MKPHKGVACAGAITKVVGLQVNLSPNLSSTRHKPLAALFQNVVHDLVNLIGFGKGETLL